jgi:lysophospholipase L1-like esterase
MRAKRRWWRVVLIALVVLGTAWLASHWTTIRAARLRDKTVAAEARAKKKAEKMARRPAQSVVARNGLPQVRAKLAAGEPVTVAFLGGSITQNGGAGGFVSMIPTWLEGRVPGGKVVAINAGIAATGSDFGAKRIDRDVLVHRPDLVVVEFAVNDGTRECAADMERIVRKTRLTNPQADILFIYTVMDWSLPKLEHGSFPKSVQQHEQIAAHYGIPTIALGYEAARKIRVGEWTWANFSADACHPTPDGYASYNHDLEAALPELLATAKPASPALLPSLTPGLIEYPAVVPTQPLPPPPALTDADGVRAAETWKLPLFGEHWVGTAEFPGGPESVWRLLYQPAGGDGRATWQPARWFEEDRVFTGSNSLPIARSRPDAGNLFGANPTASAVLVWRALVAGTYFFRVAHGGVEGLGQRAEAMTALDVVLVPRAAGAAQKLEVAGQPHGPADEFVLERRLALAAGDEVAFTFRSKGYKFVAFKNFRVTVGRFSAGEKK